MLDRVRAVMQVDLNESLALCREAVFVAQTSQNLNEEGDAHNLLSVILSKLSRFIDAIDEVKVAIALREATGNFVKLSDSLNNLGIFLTNLSDYPAALDTCFRSLRIVEDLHDKPRIARTLVNIGSIYHHLGNAEEEMKMYERSLQIANEISDQKMVAYNYLNLGLVCSRTSRYEAALKYLDGLDETFLSFGDNFNALSVLINLSLTYLKIGNFTKVLQKSYRSLLLAREMKNTPFVISSLNNIGEAKMRLGLYDEGRKYVLEAIELADKGTMKTQLRDAKQILTEIYAETGNYKNAFETLKEFADIKDDLLNSSNLKQLGELRLKFDLEKKEKEAEINQLKNVELKGALDKLQDEKNRSDSLLLNILPAEVADELKATGTAKARYFDLVTVMFIDIKNFTLISQRLAPEELVAEIDFLFRNFDAIIAKHDIEKIKTIGDAYMCAGGIPVADAGHPVKMANAALEIIDFIQTVGNDRKALGKTFFEARIGINSGPVVAGIVGSSKFAYDIWGDTVNTAARMEQSGEVGKINISGSTWQLLSGNFNCKYRGKINAKNKGEIDMYFLYEK
jgi:adenylate cyclase